MAFVDDVGSNVVAENVFFEASPLAMDKTSDWRSLTIEVSSVSFVDNGCFGWGSPLCSL